MEKYNNHKFIKEDRETQESKKLNKSVNWQRNEDTCEKKCWIIRFILTFQASIQNTSHGLFKFVIVLVAF